MKLEPLPKEITDEIRFILEGCRDGRLKHYQSDYHCGTAHCIAGWKSVLDYQKEKGLKRIPRESEALRQWESSRAMQVPFDIDTEWEGPGGVAVWKWSLTECEADILFDPNATFSEQFNLLEKLENGKRVGPASHHHDDARPANAAPTQDHKEN